MSRPSRLVIGLVMVAGALMLGSCIPLSEIILTRAMEQGGILASLVLLLMLGGSGLGLLVWGWHLARKRQYKI